MSSNKKITYGDIEHFERIFITRTDTLKIRIENETEISEALEKYGFKTVVLSDLTLDQQVELFSQVKVVVATHGAGLVNLIFSNKPTVIEIFPGRGYLPHYSSITQIREGDYYCYCADNENDEGTAFIDTAKFEKAVKRILC